jgi:N,N-dimethyl phenylurea N-demethylase beta subunit
MSVETLEKAKTGQASAYLIPAIAFYGHEAMLLDEKRFDEWTALLSPDIRYQVPVRVVTKDGEGEYDTGALRIDDTFAVIEARIKRLRTEWAWAEEPPSRVVRCVGSVTMDGFAEDGAVVAKCAVILHRQRAQNEVTDVIAYRRRDELLPDGDGFLIRKRRILMIDNVLRAPNLSIFL